MTTLMLSTTNGMDAEAYLRANAAGEAEGSEPTAAIWLVIAERFASQAKNGWIWHMSNATEVVILTTASAIALERASTLLAVHWGD